MREALVRPVSGMNYAFIFSLNMDTISVCLIANMLPLLVLSVPQTETLQVTEISGELSAGSVHRADFVVNSGREHDGYQEQH